MTQLIHVTGLDEEPFMVIEQSDFVMGDGLVTREDLENMLPEGEELKVGHYRVNDDGKAIFLGTDDPTDLLR